MIAVPDRAKPGSAGEGAAAMCSTCGSAAWRSLVGTSNLDAATERLQVSCHDTTCSFV